NPDRVANRDELEDIIAEVVRSHTAEELAHQLESASIANARMNTMDQLWEHPVLAERGRWRDVPTPGGPIRALLPPADLDGVEPRMDAVPALGEHTSDILAELGRGRAEVERLRAAGVV